MQVTRGETNLYVTDIDRSARFYCDALDFSIEESDDTFCKVVHPGFTITLFRAKGEGTGPRGKGEPIGSCPSMTADMRVDDIDEAAERIRACGGEVEEIRAWEQGRFTLFRDPDGISWELIAQEGED